jgi:hypothetical protein
LGLPPSCGPAPSSPPGTGDDALLCFFPLAYFRREQRPDDVQLRGQRIRYGPADLAFLATHPLRSLSWSPLLGTPDHRQHVDKLEWEIENAENRGMAQCVSRGLVGRADLARLTGMTRLPLPSSKTGQVVELRTERLLMRSWRDSDLAPWATMNADPEVRRYLGPTLTYEQASAWVMNYQTTWTAAASASGPWRSA